MNQIEGQTSSPETVIVLKNFCGKVAPACGHGMRKTAGLRSMNASPFHIINGIAYPRDGQLCIECVICELAAPFSYSKEKARHCDMETAGTFMRARAD